MLKIVRSHGRHRGGAALDGMFRQACGAETVGCAHVDDHRDFALGGLERGFCHPFALRLRHQHAAAVGAVDEQPVHLSG